VQNGANNNFKKYMNTYCRCLGVHEISQMYAKGSKQDKIYKKVVISTLTVHCSYNYHKVTLGESMCQVTLVFSIKFIKI
jgi:hypothetical protein